MAEGADSYASQLIEDDGHSLAYQRGEQAVLNLEQDLEQSRENDDLIIRLSHARGGFDGWQSERGLKLIICGYLPPESVHYGQHNLPFVNDRQMASQGVGGWYYDAFTLNTIVELPSIDVNPGCEVRLNGLVNQAHNVARMPQQPRMFFRQLISWPVN